MEKYQGFTTDSTSPSKYVKLLHVTYEAGEKIRQTGDGVATVLSADVSLPVFRSRSNSTMLFESWLAASTCLPVGSIVKFRGVAPPDGTIWTRFNLPDCRSIAKTAMLS